MRYADDGKICAVRVPLYSRDGSKLLYDGFWREKEFSGQGVLYIEEWLKNEMNELELLKARGDARDAGQRNEQLMERFEALLEELVRVTQQGFYMYKGEFEKGAFVGEGEEWNAIGKLLYRGEHQGRRRHGYGVSFWTNGNTEYCGNWENGAKTDKNCTMYNFTGFLEYTGGIVNGQFSGEGYKYIAPNYCVFVRYYGANNHTEECTYYHDFTWCALEEVCFGDCCKPVYAPKPETLMKEKRPRSMLNPVAYICGVSGVV